MRRRRGEPSQARAPTGCPSQGGPGRPSPAAAGIPNPISAGTASRRGPVSSVRSRGVAETKRARERRLLACQARAGTQARHRTPTGLVATSPAAAGVAEAADGMAAAARPSVQAAGPLNVRTGVTGTPGHGHGGAPAATNWSRCLRESGKDADPSAAASLDPVRTLAAGANSVTSPRTSIGDPDLPTMSLSTREIPGEPATCRL